MSKKKKVRVELRKNRAKPPRENDLTRAFQEGDGRADDAQRRRARPREGQPVALPHRRAGRGRRPTPGCRAVDAAECLRGRVLRVHGLASVVETDDGRVFRCAVRRLLKSLATDERSVVTTGDVVWVRPRYGVRRQGSEASRSEVRGRSQESEADRRATLRPALTPRPLSTAPKRA